MESYVFRSDNGNYGYIQIENDNENCTLVINRGFFDVYEKFKSKISLANHLLSSPHNDLSWITSTNPIIRTINALCWAKGEFDCLPIVDALLNSSPGGYYPRSIRDKIHLNGVIHSQPINEIETLNEIRSLSSIATGLMKAFDYVEPESANLNTYGNKLRELLILACTEVEYLWIKYLQANSYPTQNSYATRDYVKCLPHLKLDDYEVQLTLFPSLGSFRPFLGWNSQQPTQSIGWYHAYNSVKHNRGANMSMATLEAVINSIAAISILLKAQHGPIDFGSIIDMPNLDIFKTIKEPTWAINEISMPLLDDSKANWTTPIPISL